MLPRKIANTCIALGLLSAVIGLAAPVGFFSKLSSEQPADEMAKAEIAFHDAMAAPNPGVKVEEAKQRLQAARDLIVEQRKLDTGVRWWARTVGFVLVILGGILRISTTPSEN